ncbi:hypothetical protein [Actinoplanes sp. L3-i22]|nr:hypothetical protein [Actinoplanes sp. L3-i22]
MVLLASAAIDLRRETTTSPRPCPRFSRPDLRPGAAFRLALRVLSAG